MRKFYPVNFIIETFLEELHLKNRKCKILSNALVDNCRFKPQGWSIVLMFLLLTSGMMAIAQTTITDFNALPATAPLYRAMSVSTASYSVEGFVFTTVNANPPSPSTQILFSRQTKATGDYVLRSSATTVGVGYVSVKMTDGSAFKLGGFDFRFAMLAGTGTPHTTITLTGYKGGSPVSNGLISLSGLSASTTFISLPTSTASGFADIDEFRYTMEGGTGQTSYIDIDNIITSPATVATISLPTVSTTSGTLTATGATLKGNVSSDGGSTVTEKGIVFSTSSNPTTASSKLVNGTSGTGDITVDATGLTPGTTYFFKAYAINSAGTAYGGEQTFTTAAATPIVTATGTIVPFAACYASSTPGQSFTVSGNNLTGNLVITPPPGFQLSNNNIGFSGVGITLTPVSGTVATTTLYVRMAAATSSPAAGNITAVSAGATTKSIPVSGTVNALTTITIGTVVSVSTTATSFSIPYSATTGSPDTYSVSTGTRALSGFNAVNNAVLGTSPISVLIPASSAGTYDFNLRVTNGTTGCVSSNVPLTLTITAQAVTAAPVVIVPANGSMVSTATPTYAGTAPAGSVVTVYVDGSSLANTTTANTAGNWAITQPSALVQGSHTIYATAQTSGSSVSVNSNTNTFIVDAIRPTVVISSTVGASGGSTGTSPVPVTVTFSEAVTGFVAGDITTTNATISGFSGSGTTYTFNATPTASGAVTISIAANVAQDAAGNGNTAASPFSITYAQAVTAAPVVIVPANGSMVSTTTPTYGGTAPAGSTITIYSDGLSLASTTTANSAGNWAITQPAALAQGSHTVYATAQLSGSSVSANSSTNTFTVDAIRPTVVISSTAGASGSSTGTSPVPVTVTFSESVTGFVAGGITATNATISSFSGSGTTYTFNATPASSGAVTISIPANVAQDVAGNGNTAATQFSITYAQAVTAAPVVIVPANGSTVSTATPTYGGTAPAGSTITVYSDGLSLASTTTANSAGNWAITQPAALAQGSHTVYATAQTSGSSVSANSSTNTFTVDNIRPTVVISSTAGTSGSSTGTSPVPVTVTFSEAVTGFVAGDITTTNATISGFTGSGTTYTFNATPTASGAVTISIAANVAQDVAGNGNTAATQFSITYAQAVTAAPVVIVPANGSMVSTTTPTYGGTAPAGSTITIYSDGLSLASTTTANSAGNWAITQPAALSQGSHTVYATAQTSGSSVSANSSTNTFTIDAIAPVIASVSVPANGTYVAGENLDFAVEFSESTTVDQLGGTPYLSVTLNTGGLVMAKYVSGSGSSTHNYRYTVKATDKDLDGILPGALTLNGGTIKDAAGNNAVLTLNNMASTAGVLVDGTPIVAQTITFNTLVAKTYGDAAFDLNASASSGLPVSFASSDAAIASISGKTVTIHKAGVVTITATQAGNSSYSAAQSVPQTLTVDAKAIMVSANAQNKVYGTTDPALTYAVTSGTLVGIDALSGTLTREPGEGAGTYMIKQGTLAASANYTLAFQAANLFVSKATLTATANNQSKVYGQANPSLTIDYTGFVNGDTNASITTPSVASTTATLTSPVGTYTITPSGGTAANYDFTYVKGTLTVTANQPVITFASLPTKTYGDADFAPGASSTNNASAVTYTSDNETIAKIINGKVQIVGAGSANITASQAADANHSVPADVIQKLTVNPRVLVVAANVKSKTYGDANPALDYSVTSGTLVNGDTFTGVLNRTAGENVGVYAISKGTLTAGNNYQINYSGANLTITPRLITITANAKAKAYGEADPQLNYTTTNGTLMTGDAFTGTLARLPGEAAGSYAIKQGTVALTSNYVLSYVGADLTIGKATPVITFASLPTKTYGDADFAPGASSTNNTVAISYSSDNATVATIIDGKIHVVGAGLARITSSQAADANYVAAQSVIQDLVVNKAAITIAAAAKNKTYGNAEPVLTYQVTSGTLKGNDTFSGALTREPGESAGNYAIKQGTLALNSNYVITYTGADLSIGTRAITVAATAKTKIYGEADPAFAYTVTAGTLAGNDALTGTLTRDAGEAAGSYAIKQGSLSAGNNYALTYTPANLTIMQRAVNITAVAKSKTYGEVDPALTYGISSGSLVTGDTFTGSLIREAGEAAGTYAIRQGTVALNNNYVLTYTGANFTIGQALQNITFAGLPAKTYGDADFAAGATSSNTIIPVTYSSDNAAVATIVSGKIHIVGAGTTNITASQAGNANYVASQDVTRELTVSKADVTIAAVAKSKTYGEADPALTYSITSGSLKGSDVFTGALTRNAGENAGTYAIKQGTLALNNNYNLTYAGADLSIGKKAITIAAAAKAKTYGQADPALTYSITAGTLTGTDSFTGTLSRDAGENIGSYAIKQGTLALNSNYTLTYNGATLEIGKKAITVTANAQNKTYGVADPALTYTFTPALVTGDNFTGSLTRDAGENAGTYAIKQGSLALSSNYALTYTGSNLTISKKDLVITANDQNKRYGEANPALTVSYSGFISGDDAAKLTAQPVTRTAANQTSVAGSYDITVTGASSANYNITYVKGTLTISKAQLTIAAVNQSKTYGVLNPELTVTYSGFLNGDTKADLSAQPVANTIATAGSGAGSYDIVVSGAVSNRYDIVYTKGTLTVNKATLTITADNKDRTYGAINPAFTVSYNGFVNSDTQASLSAQPVINTTATAASDVGTYDIIPLGAASNNYSMVYNKGVLTIAPASRSIAFNRPLQSTYGDADFAPGATLSSGEAAVYSSDNTNVATVINGRIQIVGAGLANITASAPLNNNYTSAQPVTQQLTVNKARQSIDFASIPVLNRLTGKYDLSVVKASSGLPVSFSVADPLIAALEGNTLKANRIGTTRISASQEGNANYLPASTVVQTVEVNDADGGNEIVVRQAVSPNGDGINDFLYIEGIQDHPNNSVTVINRNGVKVFEIKGYDNNSRVFDGRSNVNNQMQQVGTYFFLLQYEGKRKTGWFVLKY
jgi:gliding motility-associated-like protein